MERKTGTKKAQKGQPKIVVTGDVAVDWFEVAAPPKQSSSTEGRYEFNWESTADMAITYSYQYETEGGIEADDALILDVYLHDGEDLWFLGTSEDLIVNGGAQESAWVTGVVLAGIEPLEDMQATEYLLIFEGRLNGYDIDDVAYIRIDDVTHIGKVAGMITISENSD